MSRSGGVSYTNGKTATPHPEPRDRPLAGQEGPGPARPPARLKDGWRARERHETALREFALSSVLLGEPQLRPAFSLSHSNAPAPGSGNCSGGAGTGATQRFEDANSFVELIRSRPDFS